MKNKVETKDNFTEEINQNELMGKKLKRFARIKLYWNLLVLPSTVAKYISISAFVCLVDIPVGIVSNVIAKNRDLLKSKKAANY